MDYKENFIEIPFGAKDSETLGWEYTIPDDMEARIEDNKIIVKKKESEDEKIRKGIIRCVKGSMPDNDFRKKYLAWLEKQKSSISIATLTWEDIENIQDLIDQVRSENSNGIGAKCLYTDVLERFLDGKQTKQKVINDTDEEIVKVVENTSILDMVEPKFKVGDWVVYCNEDVDLITGIEENGYCINNGGYIPFICASDIRLWTIQDAKDGDVLATEDKNFTTPFVAIYKSLGDTIYKGLRDNLTFNSHCFIGFNGNFYEGEDGHTIEDAHPATKEQCDLLFQKMHEAGYEWDADKKELLDYKLLINESEVLQNEINWLKSLKPQSHWKPTDEQMRSLSNAINVLHDLRENTDYGFLVSLYNDLKTLKEAGYEWDAEKKKLGKRVIDEGKAEMDYCFTKMMNGEQVSSVWSGDDEIEFNHILKTLTSVAKEQEIKGYNNLTSSINWLKSLKERMKRE